MNNPRVAVVTGAGRGLGREHALALARQGFAVVVNDLGSSLAGEGASEGPAASVVSEIVGQGGVAIANTDDVATWAGSAHLIETTIEHFGRLDALVNNAGILRDRMLVNQENTDWDDVIAVHLRGSFGPLREASKWWREQHKQGTPVDARVINTSSTSGLFGNPGQANYGTAKAGIAALTVISAMELERYGVRVNAIAPGARTRMTDQFLEVPAGDVDPYDPKAVSTLVSWLCGPTASNVTGHVFFVQGGTLSVLQGWRSGPTVRRPKPHTEGELDEVIPTLLQSLLVRPAEELLEGELS